MPKITPSAVPGKVRLRDLAGSIFDWIELTGWQHPGCGNPCKRTFRKRLDPGPQCYTI